MKGTGVASVAEALQRRKSTLELFVWLFGWLFVF